MPRRRARASRRAPRRGATRRGRGPGRRRDRAPRCGRGRRSPGAPSLSPRRRRPRRPPRRPTRRRSRCSAPTPRACRRRGTPPAPEPLVRAAGLIAVDLGEGARATAAAAPARAGGGAGRRAVDPVVAPGAHVDVGEAPEGVVPDAEEPERPRVGRHLAVGDAGDEDVHRAAEAVVARLALRPVAGDHGDLPRAEAPRDGVEHLDEPAVDGAGAPRARVAEHARHLGAGGLVEAPFDGGGRHLRAPESVDGKHPEDEPAVVGEAGPRHLGGVVPAVDVAPVGARGLPTRGSAAAVAGRSAPASDATTNQGASACRIIGGVDTPEGAARAMGGRAPSLT